MEKLEFRWRVEQTLIVGNVQIDFILNDEGSLEQKCLIKKMSFVILEMN